MWHTREVDTELDLNAASRETLLEIIGPAGSHCRFAKADGVLSRPNRRGSSGMAGNQPSSRQAPEKKEPRKPRRHFARQRMTPTRRVEHAVAVCPEGTCKNSSQKQALVADATNQGDGGRSGKGRLPIRIIQWYLETVHQLHLSVGAIVQAVHGVARQAETAVREVLEQVRASPVVQGDETGWRQDGKYVWTFSTPSVSRPANALPGPHPAAGDLKDRRGLAWSGRSAWRSDHQAAGAWGSSRNFRVGLPSDPGEPARTSWNPSLVGLEVSIPSWNASS